MVTHCRWLCHLHVSNLRLISVDQKRQQERKGAGYRGLIPHQGGSLSLNQAIKRRENIAAVFYRLAELSYMDLGKSGISFTYLTLVSCQKAGRENWG
jgi:hypothetical protein